jgi:hypothetical protein
LKEQIFEKQYFFSHRYRSIVLRALPNLKKLDNVEVTPEEVQDAVRTPVPMQHSPQEVYEQEQQYNDRNNQQTQQQQQQQYRQQSPLRDVSLVDCSSRIKLTQRINFIVAFTIISFTIC